MRTFSPGGVKLSSACELREATKSSLCVVKLLGARIFTSGAVTLSAVTPSVFKGSTCEIYEVVFFAADIFIRANLFLEFHMDERSKGGRGHEEGNLEAAISKDILIVTVDLRA